MTLSTDKRLPTQCIRLKRVKQCRKDSKTRTPLPFGGGGSTTLRNVGNHSSNDMASHARIHESSCQVPFLSGILKRKYTENLHHKQVHSVVRLTTGPQPLPKPVWRSWIRASWYDNKSNKQGAVIQVSVLSLVGSTCFERCFRPSSGALECIYSFW